MRVVIAPDKLKGTYSAIEAAEALAAGWRRVRPGDELELVPLADGGEGTAAALRAARGGEWRSVQVHDARDRRVSAAYAELPGQEAALDVAEACGVWRVADLPPDPLAATSFGAGELIRHAVDRGAKRVIVGVGGTASTDGGEGLRLALGDVPGGVELVAALDVDNPLLGPDGAAAVYGPQKGASPEQVARLERRLAALDLPTAAMPGAGAGGGIGGMLMALGATGVPGAGLIIDEVGLREQLARADLCITAEGQIDEQTLRGKLVMAVAELAAELGVAAVAVGGRVTVSELPGASLHEQGDLELAGAELAGRTGSRG